ncbi:ornithine cyclodeaminase/thiomorpholine-carboxylate dehydrogenase [Rhodoligotrophos appendicifer]|uniref:ornithine cyclodeaminase family protein n=1 Tax=Rhodoligotrophos appendicifer TaxID=987056 RepID=UPI00117D6308|nr:ornithine cyclodeaminase family protein [Rhodoligotrophos appendicifer]
MHDTLSAPGAATITKGDLPVLCLGERDVARLLDPTSLLDGLAEGFRRLASGDVQSPERVGVTLPNAGFSLSMPAWAPGWPIAVKVVNVFEGNLARGLPNHLALIALFDPETGTPLCIMDGTHITGMRTAASAVLSVRELARPDARVVTLIGAGVQGREHLRLLPLVRDFAEIRIASLHFADAQLLAESHSGARAVEDVEAAIRSSDVVCLATHAYAPVIDAGWIRPGTHVSSVGYAPPSGELPPDLLKRGRLFVETADAFNAPPVGCGELAGIDPATATALGEVLLGHKPGRITQGDITIYKAMGIAMEDLVAARIVYDGARTGQAGTTLLL